MSNHDDLFSSLLSDPATLIRLTAAYSKPAVPTDATTITTTVSLNASALNTPKPIPTGTRAVSKKKLLRAAEETKGKGFSLHLPKAGSISPTDFLAALRAAGRRQATTEVTKTKVDVETGEVIQEPGLEYRTRDDGEPVMVLDKVLQITDERSAIAAFCGYDVSIPHGTQLDSAQLLARSAISRIARLSAGSGASTYSHRDPVAHAARWSAEGFVAGLPNAMRTLLADLAGRERLAVSDLATFSNLRSFVQAGDTAAYTKLLAKDFPSTKGVKEVKNEEGAVVDYEHVSVPNPITARLSGIKGEELWNTLASLEGLALARLEAIREDLRGLNGDVMTPEQIERVHTALIGRGAPTIEEAIYLLDTTPRG